MADVFFVDLTWPEPHLLGHLLTKWLIRFKYSNDIAESMNIFSRNCREFHSRMEFPMTVGNKILPFHSPSQIFNQTTRSEFCLALMQISTIKLPCQVVQLSFQLREPDHQALQTVAVSKLWGLSHLSLQMKTHPKNSISPEKWEGWKTIFAFWNGSLFRGHSFIFPCVCVCVCKFSIFLSSAPF